MQDCASPSTLLTVSASGVEIVCDVCLLQPCLLCGARMCFRAIAAHTGSRHFFFHCRLVALLRVCSVCLQPDLTTLQLDDKLEPIIGTKQLSAAALPQALGRLLEPLKPITVTHNIV